MDCLLSKATWYHTKIETRYNAICEVEKGVDKKIVRKQNGIATSTLDAWLKNKDAIKAMFEVAPAATSRELNLSAVYFTKIEQAVLKWVLDARASNRKIFKIHHVAMNWMMRSPHEKMLNGQSLTWTQLNLNANI